MKALLLGLLLGVTNSLGMPKVTESATEGVYSVESIFHVSASMPTVREVLEDYGHLTRFVSSLSESRVLSHHPQEWLIEQEGSAKVLFVTEKFHVLLAVRELPTGLIQFHDISHRDFDVYEGSWQLASDADGVKITYQLRAKPKTHVPGFIVEHGFQASASQLLNQIQDEMVRRGRSTP